MTVFMCSLLNCSLLFRKIFQVLHILCFSRIVCICKPFQQWLSFHAKLTTTTVADNSQTENLWYVFNKVYVFCFRVQREQLAAIFQLLREKQDTFGEVTESDLQEQLKLYSIWECGYVDYRFKYHFKESSSWNQWLQLT